MKKENNYKNQSNSQKENPLKFLRFYVGKNKNKKQHVGGCKGGDVNAIAKAIHRPFYRMNIKPKLKTA